MRIQTVNSSIQPTKQSLAKRTIRANNYQNLCFGFFGLQQIKKQVNFHLLFQQCVNETLLKLWLQMLLIVLIVLFVHVPNYRSNNGHGNQC